MAGLVKRMPAKRSQPVNRVSADALMIAGGEHPLASEIQFWEPTRQSVRVAAAPAILCCASLSRWVEVAAAVPIHRACVRNGTAKELYNISAQRIGCLARRSHHSNGSSRLARPRRQTVDANAGQFLENETICMGSSHPSPASELT